MFVDTIVLRGKRGTRSLVHNNPELWAVASWQKISIIAETKKIASSELPAAFPAGTKHCHTQQSNISVVEVDLAFLKFFLRRARRLH